MLQLDGVLTILNALLPNEISIEDMECVRERLEVQCFLFEFAEIFFREVHQLQKKGILLCEKSCCSLL